MLIDVQSVRMMIQYMKESVARKLKRERVTVCLNCRKLVKCDNIGKFEECVDFEEVEGDARREVCPIFLCKDSFRCCLYLGQSTS